MLDSQPERVPKLIAAATLALRMEMHVTTVMRMSRDGRLPRAIKLGRSNYFDEAEVARRIAEQRVTDER
jgi:predicted DNA-binding transcriptional regulator AlpA